MVCFRAWAPWCTTAAVGPKNAPRWGGFRGGRWMCGGIQKNVTHLRSTSRGVSFRNVVFAVEFSRKYGRFSLFFCDFAFCVSIFQLLSWSLPHSEWNINKSNFLLKKRIKILKPQIRNPPPRYFRRCKIDSKSFQIHLDPPVEGVRMANIEVEVASTRCMPPRCPSSTSNQRFKSKF